MTSYEAEQTLVYFAEQIIKTFGKEFGVQDLIDKTLIKDNNLKEIFREWGKVIGIDEKTSFIVRHCNDGKTTTFQSDDGEQFIIELPGCYGEDCKVYTSEQIIGNIK